MTEQFNYPEYVYVGKGNASMQDEYMDFINYVFGFNGEAKDFYKLLPKLYRPEFDPAASSYVVTEHGKLKAAVGAFSHTLEVCGTELSCVGIGNVAVHPFSRGKGYMKVTMNMALDDMAKNGVDLTILGGRRARYNYFSYDRAGTTLRFRMNSDAMRHHFGKDRKPRFTVRKVKRTDEQELDRIAALSDKQIFRPIRERERLYDILISWHQDAYVAYEGDRFVGYLIYGDQIANEVQVEREEDFLDLIKSFYDTIHRDFTVWVPAFRPAFAKQLHRVCDGYDRGCSKMFSVLCFRRVMLAFLRLKQTYESLPDGEMTFLIHGRAGDEHLTVKIENGVASVEETDKTPDMELDHLDALNLIFADYCPEQSDLPSFAKLWFPLPLYMYNADVV